MSDLSSLVERFLHAYYGADHAAARALLADDFFFQGPGATFSGAEQFLASSAHVAPSVRELDVRKTFVEGADACVIYDLLLDHAVNVLNAAQWFHVENGKIASAWMFFDTAPFVRAAHGNPAEESAIDPVCGMNVDKNAPAATRTREGKTYYFCSAGCAAAFG